MGRISRRALIAAPLAGFVPTRATAAERLPFIGADRIYFVSSQDRMRRDSAVYVGVGIDEPYGPQTRGVWHRVDLRPWGVREAAKAALLTGVLIITHGTTAQVADLRVTFRRPSDVAADPSRYIAQVTEANIGGGARSPMSAWVALEAGQFDFAYQTAEPSGWPRHAAYGINLGVDAYAV